MEGRDRGKGEQQPPRRERQMPAPEDMAFQRGVPGERHEKGFTEAVIPGPEKAIRQATNKTIAGVKTFIGAQLEAERLAELAKSAAEKTKSTGIKKVFDAVTRNPGKVAKVGKLVLGPMAYVAAELAAYYLDTSLADTLNAVGDAHFNAARRALTDVAKESNPDGKATHRRTAEGALRDAYDLYESDLAARDGKILPKTAQIEAHLRATEAALLVAAINRMDPATPNAVPTWAENAREHHEEYIALATEAAENGISLNEEGSRWAAFVEGAAGPVTIPINLLLGRRTEKELFPLTHKAEQKIETHKERLTALPLEQQDFYEVYSLLVPPRELLPSDERRELT